MLCSFPRTIVRHVLVLVPVPVDSLPCDAPDATDGRSALFVQQMTQDGSVLQCQGELTKRISFKPSNVLSKAHRMLTLAVRKRAVKGSRIGRYAETADPEKVRRTDFTGRGARQGCRMRLSVFCLFCVFSIFSGACQGCVCCLRSVTCILALMGRYLFSPLSRAHVVLLIPWVRSGNKRVE